MTRSTNRGRMVALLLLASPLVASGCAPHASRFPPSADIQAATERKPQPTAEIVRSAKAEAEYNASVESWGDRLHAAGSRLCRYFRDTGMTIECPSPPAQ